MKSFTALEPRGKTHDSTPVNNTLIGNDFVKICVQVLDFDNWHTLNAFMTNGFNHPYHLNECILIFRD